MSNEVAEGLNSQAVEAFNTASKAATVGRGILDDIEIIQRTLKVMEDLTEVRICSCNNSTWTPPISTQRLKQFISDELEGRLEDLRHRFNKLGVG